MEKRFSIYCKNEMAENKDLYWCKTIYQKWDEENYPFKRRAKRIFKKYVEEHKNETRQFFLIEEE